MKKILSFILLISLLFSQNINIKAEETDNYANVVVYVEFDDTTHVHNNNLSINGCFEQDANIKELFIDDEKDRSMKEYLYNVSYGKLRLKQVIVGYDEENDTVLKVHISGNTKDYVEGGTRVEIAQIISSIVEQIDTNQFIDSSENLDLYGNDGYLDELTIILPAEYGDSNNTNITSHHTYYAGNTSINGYRIGNYSVIAEDSLYSMQGSGVLIHEFLHGLGLPDLYRNYGNGEGGTPVSLYDIMGSVNYRVPYPLAYYRNKLGWLELNTLTTSQTNVTLTAPTRASENDTQAYILKTPYSNNEFFVVEYRKKEDNYATNVGIQNYDCSIPGSGLIVYRINTNVQNTTNTSGAPWGTYIFDKMILMKMGMSLLQVLYIIHICLVMQDVQVMVVMI